MFVLLLLQNQDLFIFFFLTVFEEVNIWIVNNYFRPISNKVQKPFG